MCITKVYGINAYVEETCLVVDFQRGENVNHVWDADLKVLLSDNAYLGHVHKIHYKPWAHEFLRPKWIKSFEMDMLECIPVRVRLFR